MTVPAPPLYVGPAASRHAMDQARARYGIAASEAEWEDARQAIIAAVAGEPSRATLLFAAQKEGAARWLVPLGASSVIAVYRPAGAIIVTVLPPGARSWQPPAPRQNAPGRARHEREVAEVWE